MANRFKWLIPFLLMTFPLTLAPNVSAAGDHTLRFTALSPAPFATVAPGPHNVGATVEGSANIAAVTLELSGQGTIVSLSAPGTTALGVYKTVDLAPGAYTLTMAATDSAGGKSVAQWDFTVGNGGESQWFTADGKAKAANFNATMQSLVQAFRYHLFGQSWDGSVHPEMPAHAPDITPGAPLGVWASPDGTIDQQYTTATLQSLVEAFRWHLFGISWKEGATPDMVTHAAPFQGPQAIDPWFDSAGRPVKANIDATLTSLVQAMRWHFWSYSWDGQWHQEIPTGSQSRTVVLDPGHGGPDTGAITLVEIDGRRVPEKVFDLEIARRAANLLRADGFNVVLTREQDVSVNSQRIDRNGDGEIDQSDELQARNDIANAAHADLLISVHLNAYGNPATHGTQTFYCGSRTFSDKNKVLASLLQKATLEALARRGYSPYDRGASLDSSRGPGHLAVLGPGNGYIPRPSLMPASLMEGLFVSNPQEAELLKSGETLDEIARAIDVAVKGYFQVYP